MEPERGFYNDPVFVFDFASLYPTIIQSDNICPMRLLYLDQAHLLENDSLEIQYAPINSTECIALVTRWKGEQVPVILPTITDEVCQERKAIRKDMKGLDSCSFEYQSLNAKQLACKVFQNALYGTLGVNVHPKFAIPVLMAVVCKIGQYMVRTVSHDFISKYSAFCVYGDTDSVMVQLPGTSGMSHVELSEFGRNIESKVSCLFPSPHALELEKIYIRSIFFDKKMYAGLLLDRSIEVKGLAFKKRDKCRWVREIGYSTITNILLENTSGLVHTIKAECQRLVDNLVSLADLTITRSLKVRSEYKSSSQIQLKTADKITRRTGRVVLPGSRVEYVIVQGGLRLCERGEPPEYLRNNPDMKVDKIYYIHNQLNAAIVLLLQFHVEEKRGILEIIRDCDITIRNSELHIRPIVDFFAPSKKRNIDKI